MYIWSRAEDTRNFTLVCGQEQKMKKDKSLTANDKSTNFGIIKSPVTGSEIPLIDENLLKKRIHTIRGFKVMLDADLAEIYGYTTKAFNQQVKNNIEKFAKDFRFQLNSKEVDECSRSKMGMRTNSWTQLEDASCTLLKNKSPRLWKHFMI